MDTPNATNVDAPNATRANSALWAHYIEQQWGGALTPFGGVLASGLIGIAVANMYAAAWGDFIGRLFASNAPAVTKFAQENVADVLPPWPATPLPEASDTVPPWLRVTLEEIEAADRARGDGAREERGRERLVVPV
jgi:hypothetical protein